MGFSKLSPKALVFSLFIFFAFLKPSFAAKKSYVVLLGSHSHGLGVSEVQLQHVTNSHYKLLGSFLGSNKKAKDAIFYSYKKHINGFGAVLEEEEAANLAEHTEVGAVLANEMMELHTTHSWSFMHLERNSSIPSSAWRKARFGEDTIIAGLDTGVWPESMSFRDDGITKPIPSKWKGSCENPQDPQGFKCNRKLIGAKFFNQGYIAHMRLVNSHFHLSPEFNSTRDYAGHGSHTLSTAGGNFVSGKDVFGSSGFGSAKGGSPRARVAAYKVCWGRRGHCSEADILQGLDEAIHDGVDIVSYSAGRVPSPYYQDGFAIASFHAVKNGVSVVCSAGNNGPNPRSVANVAPWLLTVGASSLDRRIEAVLQLHNGQSFQGGSLSKSLPEEKYYPLISGAQAAAIGANIRDARLCKPEALDPTKVNGTILVCLRGETAVIDKGAQAAQAGAVGMILCNALFDDQISADLHVLPAIHIGYQDGLAVINYIDNTRNPSAYLVPPTEKFDLKPAPFMANFSSRGPNVITPEIIKPDITAPGMDIIAATTQAHGPSDDPSDNRRVPYLSMSGTSMSCPHISGIVGLLKTLHPDWSPAAIKSAIMTSARVRDNTLHPMQDGESLRGKLASPFSYGSGHVQPVRAMDPGLVYDLTTEDYLNFLCALGYDQRMMRPFSGGSYQCPPSASLLNFNYPSIGVQNLKGKVTVTRKLKNVGTPGSYKPSVRRPEGVNITVEPRVLKFDKVGEEKSFNLTLSGALSVNAVVHGILIWSDGNHFVSSPIVVSSGSF